MKPKEVGDIVHGGLTRGETLSGVPWHEWEGQTALLAVRRPTSLATIASMTVAAGGDITSTPMIILITLRDGMS